MNQIAHLSQLRLAIALLIVSLLSGCGFHFRGNYLVPEEVDSMSLTSYDDYAQFTRDVKMELRHNGIDIVTPAANVTNIHLISESVSERTLSLYQNSRAAEKELTLYASYRVVVPEVGIKTFRTQVNRSYLDNPLTALAKSVERDMIEDEMRKQAARQIIRQLARLRTALDNDEDALDTFINDDGVLEDNTIDDGAIDDNGVIEGPSFQQQNNQISLQAEYEKNDPVNVPATQQDKSTESLEPATSESVDTTETNTEVDASVDSESDITQ